MANKHIQTLIKSGILNAKAYHVPAATGLIKLDAMENPYRLPEVLIQEWQKKLLAAEINRYPDASTHDLKQSFRTALGVPDDIDIMFGNGSDELIQTVLLSLRDDAGPVMAPEPTFVMYRLLSSMLDMEFIGVPLNKDFSLDTARMLNAIKQHQPAVIFLAWPNNPTGNACCKDDIIQIINATKGLVVIDEAYHAFAEQTMMSSLLDYSNVVLMRTLSKLGLAGLRLGAMFARPEWIEEFNKLRLPYNIGTLNQITANFVLEHIDVLNAQAASIRIDRESLFKNLSTINNIQVWKSLANFILFRIQKGSADEVHQGLIDKGILIKKLHGSHPLLENCLRVTVGAPAENSAFINALTEIMQ